MTSTMNTLGRTDEFPLVDIQQIDRGLGRISLSFAQQHGIMPVSYDAGILTVAVAESHGGNVEAELRRHTNLRTIHVERRSGGVTEDLRALASRHRDIGTLNSTENVLVGALITTAVRGGSDVYCVPGEEDVRILSVVNGETRVAARVSRSAYESDILGVLPPQRIKHHNPQLSQSGHYDIRRDGVSIQARMRTYPRHIRGADGPEIVPILNFRLHPDQRDLPSISTLGAPPSAIEELIRTIALEGRQIIVSGLPGMGKTTLLYVVLRHLARTRYPRIFTMEAPIEVFIDELMQQEFSSISDGAEIRKALLQMAPQIVFIGEALGAEEFLALTEFLETGVTSITTFHERSALGALHRARMMAGSRYIHKLGLVWAQTLASPVCTDCASEMLTTASIRNALLAYAIEVPQRMWQRSIGVECDSCAGLGVVGPRIALVETLRVTRTIRNAIASDPVGWRPEDLAKDVYSRQCPSIAMQAALALSKGVIDAEQFLFIAGDIEE